MTQIPIHQELVVVSALTQTPIDDMLEYPFHQWMEQPDGSLSLWLGLRKGNPNGTMLEQSAQYFQLNWRDWQPIAGSTESESIQAIVVEWIEQGLEGLGVASLERAEQLEIEEAASWVVPYIERFFNDLAVIARDTTPSWEVPPPPPPARVARPRHRWWHTPPDWQIVMRDEEEGGSIGDIADTTVGSNGTTREANSGANSRE